MNLSSSKLLTLLAAGLLACVSLLAPTVSAQTVSLPKKVVIKPIFVQNGPGGSIAVQDNFAASFTLYQEATQRVYAQAGIRIVWEPAAIFVSSTYYTITDSTTADDLVVAPGAGQSTNPTTLNVWFTGPSGSSTAGISQQSYNVPQGFLSAIFKNGATVSETAFNASSLTNLPHEIGHVLGLNHTVIGAGPQYDPYNSNLVPSNNLMAQGTGATSLSAITVDGVSGLGVLTALQIQMLKLSPLVQNNSVANDFYSYSGTTQPSVPENPVASVQENFVGNFAEPADGGNLDVVHSTFDGNVAVLSPRWHESEALGSGAGARRWRNMLFAIRGVQGKIVTFRLPMQLPANSVMVHNMDTTSFSKLKPVWSNQAANRTWNAFTAVERYKPNVLDILGLSFPLNSLVDLLGNLTVSTGSARKEDYGWQFKNTVPFTQDVVYISINEHYPVQEYFDWLETSVFSRAWVKPTASEVVTGTFLIGYQSGASATSNPNAFARTVPDMPLYAFKIQDPTQHPTKLVILASGQHPYEGQNKAALRGAIEWILNPTDPEAAAYRSQYVTLVYPFVNPTGEYAGLWRGTAYAPLRDTNRHWDTTLVRPTDDRGIDTVIIHKKAMTADVVAIGLGTPYAVFDYHQNFGDLAPNYDYAEHANVAAANTYVTRLKTSISIFDDVSNPTSSATLRGYWGFKGVPIPMTFERSVYNTLASERIFGAQTVRALAPAAAVTPPPAAASSAVTDTFAGSGVLAGRTPDTATNNGAKWATSQGAITIAGGLATTTNDYARTLINVGTGDATVEAKISLLGANGYAGLTLRASDSNNFLFFRIKTTGWVLGQVVGGAGSTLASGTGSYIPGTAYTLRAECNGTSIKLLVNGTSLYTGTPSSNRTAVNFGFSSGTTTAFSVDSFTSTPVSTTSSSLAAAELVSPVVSEPVVSEPIVSEPVVSDPTVSDPVVAAPVSSALVSDTFTGSGSLAARCPDTATASGYAWALSGGTVTVVNGTANAASTYVRAFVNAGAADASVSAKITLQAAGALAGIVFRASDSNNFLYFRIKTDGWVFGQVVAGVGTTLATGTTANPLNVASTLGALCQGNSIQLLINGAAVYTGSSTVNQTATSFGISSGVALPFSTDDFTVTP